MKRNLLVVLLIMAATSVALGQAADKKAEDKKAEDKSAAEQSVLKLTKDWIDAENRRDGAALNRILADDFTATAPSGDIIIKKMVVPDPKGQGGGLSFTGDDFITRVYGDTAVVTGNGTWKEPNSGTLCFTLVFVKRKDAWQMVNAHIANVPTK